MLRFLSLLFISLIIEVFVIGVMKFFRFSFPPSEIGPEKIIGYAQYYGYPFYFDTFAFFVFLLIPIVVLLIARIVIKP